MQQVIKNGFENVCSIYSEAVFSQVSFFNKILPTSFCQYQSKHDL